MRFPWKEAQRLCCKTQNAITGKTGTTITASCDLIFLSLTIIKPSLGQGCLDFSRSWLRPCVLTSFSNFTYKSLFFVIQLLSVPFFLTSWHSVCQITAPLSAPPVSLHTRGSRAKVTKTSEILISTAGPLELASWGSAVHHSPEITFHLPGLWRSETLDVGSSVTDHASKACYHESQHQPNTPMYHLGNPCSKLDISPPGPKAVVSWQC